MKRITNKLAFRWYPNRLLLRFNNLRFEYKNDMSDYVLL